MIQGGWPFVLWAYGIAYGGLIAYGLLLWRRSTAPQNQNGSAAPTPKDTP